MPNLTNTISAQEHNTNAAISAVMHAAHEMAEGLVQDGVLLMAESNEAPGEASCLEIQFAPSSVPFYVQPMCFDDEPNSIDLYVECTAIPWEPVGFTVSIGDPAAAQESLTELRDYLIEEAIDYLESSGGQASKITSD